MGKKFARFAAAFIAIAVAISVVVPAAVSFAASTSEEENTKYSLQGLLEWLQEDETVEELGLTTEQQNDIANAVSMLKTYSTTYYNEALCIDVTDEDDAANLDNVLYALEVLEDIEELRNDDPYYNQLYSMTNLYTNFSMMVGSAYTANVSIYEVAHVSSYSTFSSNEGLSWGSSTPDDSWYSEIEYIDAAMEQLGYSVESLTTSQWSSVTTLASSLAAAENGSIGHYTGLFYGVSSGSDTLMGVGYTTESYRYRRTSSYNATTASAYTSKNMAVYTISDFEKIVNTYICEEVNGEHTYISEVTTEATCTTDGVMTYTCSVCGDSYTETIDATGHTEGEAVTENEVVATCTEDGSYDTVTYCTVCDVELSRTTTTVVAIGHSYTSYVSNDDATCTEDGTKTAECDNGCGETDTVTDEGSALGHSWDEGTVTAAPTCTEEGVTTYTCQNDSSHTYTETIDALGHDYEAVVTEPTCTEEGYTTYTCSRCGDSYVGDYTDATGHTAGEAVIENEVAATCTEDGSYDTVVYCTVCGEELSRETVTVAATGHSYDSGTVTTEPTCTETGTKTYTCTVCGDTYTETVAATGHTAGEAVIENEVAATCTEDGSYDTVVYCAVCDAELSRTTVIVAATGHSYDGGTVTTEPTCTEAGVLTYTCENDSSHTYTEVIAALGHDYVATETTATCTEPGITTYTCSRCDDTYTETVAEALGHSWDEGTVTTEPTCTEEGVLTYTCTRCGETYTETIDALGHTAGEAVTENEVAATCTEDGSYDSVVYCTVCDEELSRETTTIAATGHTLELVAAVTATCTEDGNIAHYECQTCGALFADADAAEALSASDVVVAATGHSYDGGTVTTEPTCTEAGVLTYTCENDSSHTYTETIDALGHSWDEGVVTEPTCTEAGYTTYTCTVCGATTTGDEVAALGHTWGEWVTISSPTCTDAGSQQRVCEVCGTVETEDLDATGHSWESDYTVDMEPACDTDGSQSIHCSACDAVTDSQTIAALGHSWDEGVVTATAFGSDTGEITYTCTTCGETYTVAFSYEVISGADQTIEQGSALSATANGALDKLVSIEVDGAEVDADNYTLVSGSTVLTLSSEYVSTLELGEHTLCFVYEDGDASTTFTIVAATVEDEGDEDTDADEDADSDADTDDATDATTDATTDDATDDATADTETDADSDEDEDDEEIVPATGDSQALLAATVAAAGAVLVAAGMADRRRRQR